MHKKLLISSVLTLTLALAACGQQNATQSVQKPSDIMSSAPGDGSSNATSNILEGIVFDEQAGKRLFTAQNTGDIRLDFLLYVKDITGQVTKLPLPEGDTRAMGAAFAPDGGAAYVLVRFNETAGMQDVIYRVDLRQREWQELHRVASDEAFALSTNGLRFHQGSLEFSGMRKAPDGDMHPVSAIFRLPLNQNSLAAQASTALQIVPADSPAATDYQRFAEEAARRDLAAQRVTSKLQAQATTGYYNWPKAGAGHHSGGSGFHINDAQYALDINRSSGNLDEGDDILAAQAGSVVNRGTGDTRGTYGNFLVIRHGNGTETLYAHMLTGTFLPASTTYVGSRQFLGEVGQSGLDHADPSQTAHLHFHLRPQGSTSTGYRIGTPTHGMNVRVISGTGTSTCFTEALTNSDMRFTNKEYTSC